MRTAFFTQLWVPEVPRQLSDIVEELVARGHDVSVVTGFPNYPTGRIYEGWRQRPWANYSTDGYHLKRVAHFPSHDSSAVRRAASYLSFGLATAVFGWRELRAADVVYVYHPPLTTALGPWVNRVLGGAPFVLHVQDLWPESVVAADMIDRRVVGRVSAVLARLCAAVYRRAGAVICIAPTMARLLHERGVPASKVEVVDNWADETIYFPTERRPELLRSLGLDGCTTVMFAGNMGVVQGLDTVIEAAARVRELDDFRLVLVGDGVERESLQQLAGELGAGNVVFLGSRPRAEMNDLIAAADAQVVSLRDLPHLRGTIPSKLGTVMACGRPVICSVAGDARAMVERAGAGWTCDSDDADALAQAFRAVHAASPAEREKRGAAARTFYEATMAKSISVPRIEQILSRTAAAEAAPDRRRRPVGLRAPRLRRESA
ncbi:glycosyltransferase family 4 protein [Geodermatophilus sp. CPCC 205506]|uniref:glycosyltransferase family 4 protein n=1 Tax=Geodermatophilus sp. CPCC 205506 TaxID=2936596 RepID=UPI003EEA233A